MIGSIQKVGEDVQRLCQMHDQKLSKHQAAFSEILK